MPIARPGETGTLDHDPSEVHSRGEDPIPVRRHNRDAVPADVRTIPGWGVDLDFARRNVFPMELRSDVRTARGDVEHWQVAQSTIHISNEHPGLTPVFGDTLPPRGLSGLLRNYAYEYGEATNRHWMGLMLADRIERIERLFGDALQGRPDNIVAERAWPTKLAHMNRTKATGTVAAAAVVGAVLVGLALWRRARE